jgi:hypothetical protein
VALEIKSVSSQKELAAFIDLPWSLYAGDPNWVPPLRMAIADQLSPKHPFYETSDIAHWMAFRDGKAIGRISAVDNRAWNQFHEDKAGFFGFFECTDDSEAARALFDQAKTWLLSKGKDIMVGPVNLSTNYECGTLVTGFDDPPQIMMTYNPAYHDRLYNQAGFEKAKDLLAYKRDVATEMPELIRRIAARVQEANKVSFRFVERKNWDAEVARMLEIYNDAWEKNWGFVPMTPDEFRHTAKDLKSVVNERLVQFVEVDGDPAGFIVALPDFNQVLAKVKDGRLFPTGVFKILLGMKKINRLRVITMGIKAKYRRLGLETLLYTRSQEEARALGFVESEMSWVLEDNLAMNKPIQRMGGIPYKRYRLYQKRTDQ